MLVYQPISVFVVIVAQIHKTQILNFVSDFKNI
jgi:hypothetical protein